MIDTMIAMSMSSPTSLLGVMDDRRHTFSVCILCNMLVEYQRNLLTLLEAVLATTRPVSALTGM